MGICGRGPVRWAAPSVRCLGRDARASSAFDLSVRRAPAIGYCFQT
jgi:hypothetical protein